MNNGRFFSSFALAFVLNCLLAGSVFASFGFWNDLGKSGIDFTKGYDVNTVTTVSGRVVSSPWTDEKGNLFVDIKSGREVVSLSLGPQSAWAEKDVPLHPNDDVVVRGSRAQGKDGRNYLLVQKLNDKTTGSQMAVRNEHGGPTWLGNNGGGMMSNGPGGGMMRGGGGGMMRR